jgi:hypothetical protein
LAPVVASWKRRPASCAHAFALFGFAVVLFSSASTRFWNVSLPLVEPPELPWMASMRPPLVAPPMPNSTRPPPMRIARLR